jgi:hypothetical protein
MSSQWLRRTEAVSNGFEFGHAAIGQRTGPDRVIAQNLFKRENLRFGNEHSVSAGLRRRCSVGFAAAMLGDGFPDDAKLKTKRRGAVLSPMPEGRLADRFDDLRRLMDVVKTLVVNDDWAEAFSHPHIAQGTAHKVKRRVN